MNLEVRSVPSEKGTWTHETPNTRKEKGLQMRSIRNLGAMILRGDLNLTLAHVRKLGIYDGDPYSHSPSPIASGVSSSWRCGKVSRPGSPPTSM